MFLTWSISHYNEIVWQKDAKASSTVSKLSSSSSPTWPAAGGGFLLFLRLFLFFIPLAPCSLLFLFLPSRLPLRHRTPDRQERGGSCKVTGMQTDTETHVGVGKLLGRRGDKLERTPGAGGRGVGGGRSLASWGVATNQHTHIWMRQTDPFNQRGRRRWVRSPSPKNPRKLCRKQVITPEQRLYFHSNTCVSAKCQPARIVSCNVIFNNS